MLLLNGMMSEPLRLAWASYTGSSTLSTVNSSWVYPPIPTAGRADPEFTLTSGNGTNTTLSCATGGRYIAHWSMDVDHPSSVVNNHFMMLHASSGTVTGRGGVELKSTSGFEAKMAATALVNGLTPGGTLSIGSYQYGSNTAVATHLDRSLQVVRIPSLKAVSGFACQGPSSNTAISTSPTNLPWSRAQFRDAGITHSTSVNNTDITLDNTGLYLLGYQTGHAQQAGTAAVNLITEATLNGSAINDTRMIAARWSSNGNAHSVSYTGLIRTASPNSVLRITAQTQTAATTPAVRGDDSFIHVQRLPEGATIMARRTTNNSVGTTNQDHAITLETTTETHTAYTHSSSRITVNTAGTYMWFGTLRGTASSTGHFTLGFRRNGVSDYANGLQRGFGETSGGQTQFGLSTAVIYAMSPGDYVELFLNNSAGCTINAASLQGYRLDALVDS